MTVKTLVPVTKKTSKSLNSLFICIYYSSQSVTPLVLPSILFTHTLYPPRHFGFLPPSLHFLLPASALLFRPLPRAHWSPAPRPLHTCLFIWWMPPFKSPVHDLLSSSSSSSFLLQSLLHSSFSLSSVDSTPWFDRRLTPLSVTHLSKKNRDQ